MISVHGLRVVLLCVGLWILAGPAWAATYYVDCATGSDSNPGTTASPFLTIQHALNTVAAGDTVRIKAPTCRVTDSLDTAVHGTASQPITLTADSDAWTLRGSELFASGWTQSGATWWHSLTEDPGVMVLFDEVLQAQWVEQGACPADLDTDHAFCIDTGAMRLYVHSATDPATRWTTPGVEVVQGLLTSGNQAQMNLINVAHSHYTLRACDLQQSGNRGLNILGTADHLTVESCEIAYSMHNANRSCAKGDCTGGKGLFVMAAGADEITIRDSTLHDPGRDMLRFAGSGTNTGLTVERTRLYNAFNHAGFPGAGGTNATGNITQVTWRQVEIHDTCGAFSLGNTAGTQDKTILSMTIEDTWVHDQVHSGDARVLAGSSEACGSAFKAGVTANGTGTASTLTMDRFLVANYDIALHTATMHAGTTLSLTNSLFYNAIKAGVDLSEAASGLTVRDTIVATIGGGTASGLAEDFVIGCLDSADCSDFTSRDLSGMDYNVYLPNSGVPVGFLAGVGNRTLAQWQTDTGADANSLEADPLLTDPANDDFTLAAGSPAIGTASDGTSDRGLFPTPPVVASCEIGSVANDTLVVNWTNNDAPPIQSPDNTQFAVTYDAAGQTETGTVVSGTNQTQTTLAAAATSGQDVDLVVSAAAVTDSALIGNVLNAPNRASGTIQCTNNVAGSALAEITGLVEVPVGQPVLATDHEIDNLFDNCVDGGAAPDCAVGDGTLTSFQVVVDLGGASHNLTRLQLYGDDSGNWYCVTWDGEYSTGDDTGPWTSLFSGAGCNGQQYWTQNFTAVNTRYVRLTVHGNPAGGTEVRELKAFEEGSGTPTLTQTHNVVKLWDGAVDHTNYVRAVNLGAPVSFLGKWRHRFGLACTGGDCPDQGYKVQFNKNATGWVDVSETCSATDIILVPHPEIANGTAVTRQFATSPKPFVSGGFLSDPGVPTIPLADGEVTELEKPLALCAAAQTGDIYQLRIVPDGSGTLDNYEGAMQITASPGSISGVGF